MSDKKYIVMSKFDHSDKFIMERGFSTRKDANTYAKLMMDSKDYDHIQYYCFEQTMDYNFYYDVNLEKKDNIDELSAPCTRLRPTRQARDEIASAGAALRRPSSALLPPAPFASPSSRRVPAHRRSPQHSPRRKTPHPCSSNRNRNTCISADWR